MSRLLFEKTGNAVWISHLDLMRVLQRAFQRAGLALKHTQGYNPRPSVSIALPLSVGVESQCELLDFDLNGEGDADLCSRLNRSLIPGVKVLAVYDQGRKLKELAYLDCLVTLEYDRSIPEGAQEEIAALFARDSLTVEKKSKNGISQQDVIPLIHSVSVRQADPHTLEILARIRCQNPALNPMQLHAAIRKYLPEMAPDFARCRRIEIYDENNTVFR